MTASVTLTVPVRGLQFETFTFVSATGEFEEFRSRLQLDKTCLNQANEIIRVVTGREPGYAFFTQMADGSRHVRYNFRQAATSSHPETISCTCLDGPELDISFKPDDKKALESQAAEVIESVTRWKPAWVNAVLIRNQWQVFYRIFAKV